MKATEFLRWASALLPPFALACFLPTAPEGFASPGAVFAILSAYARLARLALGLSSSEGAFLFAGTLPFLAFAASLGEGRGALAALVLCAEGAIAGAALLSLQERAFGAKGGFSPVLAFAIASAAAGFAMDASPAAPFAAACATVLGLSRYAAARRRG